MNCFLCRGEFPCSPTQLKSHFASLESFSIHHYYTFAFIPQLYLHHQQVLQLMRQYHCLIILQHELPPVKGRIGYSMGFTALGSTP